MNLVFPTADTLLWALNGGIVPPSVSLAPARFGRTDGRPWLVPHAAIPDGLAASLRQFGVTIADMRSGGEPIMHWFQALPLERSPALPELADQKPVLFDVSTRCFAEFASEMLRLGNDRQSYRVLTNDRVLLRVLDPPYFSLLRALGANEADPPRAFLEHAPGIWIEFGWMHPLASQLRAPDGQFVLLRQSGQWQYLDVRPFHDIYDALDFRIDEPAVAWADAPMAEPLDVPLRLAPGNTTDPAELWVLPHDGESQIDEVVRTAESRLLDRLTFGVGVTESGLRPGIVQTRWRSYRE